MSLAPLNCSRTSMQKKLDKQILGKQSALKHLASNLISCGWWHYKFQYPFDLNNVKGKKTYFNLGLFLTFLDTVLCYIETQIHWQGVNLQQALLSQNVLFLLQEKVFFKMQKKLILLLLHNHLQPHYILPTYI